MNPSPRVIVGWLSDILIAYGLAVGAALYAVSRGYLTLHDVLYVALEALVVGVALWAFSKMLPR